MLPFFIFTNMDFKPEAIIFDFGGVLINIDYDATVTAFQKLGVEHFEELYSKAVQSDLFDRFETGQISAQRFINALLDYLPPGTTPNQIVSAWNAMIGEVPTQGIDLLAHLKEQGIKLFLLSNTNEIHIPIALKKWALVAPKPFNSYFDKVYLSHEIKTRKPNSSAFDLVCTEQSLVKAKTLFIDDSIQHIEGAQKYGLQTFHLVNQQDLYSLFS